MKKLAWMLGLVATASLATLSLASAQIDPNRTVMTVNGEEVKASEYYSRMEFLPGVGRSLGNGNFEIAPPGLLTLQLLLEERLTLQLAKEKGVFPTKAQVTETLDLKKERNPNFEKDFAAFGLSPADLEYQMTLETAQFNLLTLGINVTDLEVENYYKGNAREFTSPRLWTLRMIAVKPEDKTKVDDALKAGRKFEDVAKEMSQDSSRANGGLIGDVPVDQFSETVQKTLDGVKIGQTSDWIAGERVAIKFLKVNIIPEKVAPLTDILKKRIRRNLMVDRGVVKNDLEKMLREARQKAKVQLIQPQFKNEFDSFLKKYGIGAG